MNRGRTLKVLVDGVALAEPDARALWQRFSAWMDERPADLAGFARSEGFTSVHPELHAGSPALVASHSSVQRPYGPAKEKAATKSPARTTAKPAARSEKTAAKPARRLEKTTVKPAARSQRAAATPAPKVRPPAPGDRRR